MSMNIGPTDGQGNGLLYVGFNQDQGTVAVIPKNL